MISDAVMQFAEWAVLQEDGSDSSKADGGRMNLTVRASP